MHVGMAQAYGISLIVALFTATPKTPEPEDDQTFTQVLIQGFLTMTLKPLFLLGIGWFVHAVFQ
jgi:hypothetical protein